MERLFRGRAVLGEFKPDDPAAYREGLINWPHAVVFVALQDEKRVRSNAQNRYWWGTCVPTVLSCWKEKFPKYTFNPQAVHGALVQARFGRVWTPLGPQRVSSTVLTTEEFADLIEWTKDYAREEFDVYIPEPNEVMT